MKLSKAQKQEIKEVFEDLDTEDTGLLDEKNLYKALRALGLEVPVTEQEINQLLVDVGRSEEGYVTIDDVFDIVSELMTNRQDNSRSEQLHKAFQLLSDPQLNGITFKSLKRACQVQNESFTDGQLNEMIAVADKHQDGVILFPEFQRIWTKIGL
ncbi:uncharacterized protein BYT42DRAFT_322056 [Radiomyces spectabilis]|uniref:uncharacterized protein n=1 Tax=Radiomyces spectabilis TaxID=64574 RepID=UPI002220431E|nr:uncharacterized protein BYT42DRAFT_322056 [Radiomyces spectabilis]KAI8379298.1 hypothetical protein BYT42DRAFT_322056 [Radiomyces spectabilis]